MGPDLDSGPGPWVGEEDLVGSEKAHSLLEILEVHVVELSGGVWIHVYGYPWIDVSWTHSLKLRCVCWIQRRVHWISSAEIVDSVCELSTMGESKGS